MREKCSARWVVVAIGLALVPSAGCTDGCLRHSDCASGMQCSETVCIVVQLEGATDAGTVSEPSDADVEAAAEGESDAGSDDAGQEGAEDAALDLRASG